MKQFLKFTLASCLGVFIALSLMFLLLISVGISASVSVKPQVKKNTILSIAPAYAMPEHTNNVQPSGFSFQFEDVIGISDMCAMIDNAAADDNISGILFDPTRMGVGLIGAHSVMASLKRFRESGKFVVSYANYYEQLAYYMASASDAVILNPIGSVDFRGFASFVPFYKELLDKTGIRMQIYYAGEYKSATESFRRTEMSPENRFQTREYLDDAYADYLNVISDNRGMSTADLRDIANNMRAGNSREARETGLVDVVGHDNDAMSWIRNRLGMDAEEEIATVDFNDYYLTTNLSQGSGSDRIAVVYAEGAIVHGESEYGVISDKDYTKIFDDLRKSDRIKAVVIRVNSPGGSILASENILQAVRLLQESGKPVVVSMSDYAASGGYYISCTADSIFAEESTLTGSIGVFSLIPNLTELMNDKLGIRFDTVRTGDFSASFSPFLEWSEPEHAFLQSRTDEFYNLFLEVVSEGREMPVDAVDKVARGRIWSGTDAVSAGLVDRVASLDEAVSAAASLAGLEAYKIMEYPRLKDPWTKFISDMLGEDIEATADTYIDAKLAGKFPAYRDLQGLINWEEPMARLPMIVRY